MKRISIILAVMILASATLFAWEHENQGRLEQKGQKVHPRRVGEFEQKESGMRLEMMEELNLTDAQVQKIESIKTAHRKQQIRLKADLEILQIDKREAMRNKQFADTKKINAEISKIKLQMANAKVDNQAGIWNELTDKQKEKAETAMKNHHKNRKNKMAKKNKRK